MSTRNITQGFAKYLSPKITLHSTQRVAAAPAAAHEKPGPTSYPSPYKLDGKFGPTSTLQLVSRRFAHTDVPAPDFTTYRRDATKDPSSVNAESDMPRRAFTYMMVGGMGVVGAHAGKSFVSIFQILHLYVGAIQYDQPKLSQFSSGKPLLSTAK